MPGPNGELCSTCYFWEQIDEGPYGYCRHDNAAEWIEAKGALSARVWPKTHGTLDWSGDWRDRTAPATSFLATGGLITPTDTAYTITGGGTWQHYNPGNMFASSIVFNCTTDNDTITWDIPGNFPPGAQFIADYAVFGSIDYASAAQEVQWTLGPSATNLPFSDDIFQQIDITNQVDDISLPFGFAGGPAISSQTGDVRVLCRATATENITIESLFFQIRITVL